MIKGVIFDKDGTLFDFNATWGAWVRTMIMAEADSDPATIAALADALGYDLTTSQIKPGSIVIAETGDVVADHILRVLPDLDKADLLARMDAAASLVPQVPATDLGACLSELKNLGLTLGVATNDSEKSAHAHLEKAGIAEHFRFVAGFDSGFGGKPAARQLHGFCEAVDLQPNQCVMVGDSLHDLHAGRAAGMQTVGVLTGPALHEELAPHADIVLPSIAELAAWIKNTT